MLRLEPTNNNQTIRFIPSEPYDNGVNPYLPYSFVFLDEETKDVNVINVSGDFVTNDDGVVTLTKQWGFSANQENHYLMMYVMSKPISATIMANNYLYYFGYVVYSCKIFLMDNNSLLPQLYSVNNVDYYDYTQQPSDNDFIIL